MTNLDAQDPSVIHEKETHSQEPTKEGVLKRFAWIVRYMGVAAVILSALIFMLQGVDDIGSLFRHWTWLALMVSMAGAGVVCRNVFDSVRSARILFALAAALVPVQFSQLGGMAFHYLSGGSAAAGALSGATSLNLLSPFWLSVDVLASTALAAVLAYAAFAILVRRSSKVLALSFVGMNLLMLVPFRNDYFAWAVVSASLATLSVIEFRVFKRFVEFRTIQAFVLRTILALPFGIMLVRNSFHFNGIENIFLLLALFSLLINYGFANGMRRNVAREYVLLLGGVVGMVSWVQFAVNVNLDSLLLIALVPVLVLSELARLSSHWRRNYIKAASVSATLMALLVCAMGPSLLESVFLVLLSAGAIAIGIVYQRFMPLLGGLVMAIVSMSVLVAESLGSFSVNIWLLLAVGGAVLVLGSAAIEKYASRFTETWQAVKQYQ
ncbi:MAG: hypothetical protein K6L76_06170 [Agarilytica sp.]